MKKGPLIILLLITLVSIIGALYTFKPLADKESSTNSEIIQLPKNGDFEIVFETESVNLPPKPPWLFYSDDSFYPQINQLVVDDDIWITEIKPEIEGAPSEVLHHGALFFDNIADKQCPNSNKIFYSASKEMTAFIVPKGTGYFIPKGTTIKSAPFWMHFRNDTEQGYQNAKYKLYVKGTKDKSEKLKSLDIFWLNNECSILNEYIFPVPANSKFSRPLQEPYITKEDFQMHFFSYHVHDYGSKFELKVNGDVIWTSYPETDGPLIKSITVNYPQTPVKINKGDVVDIVTYYDNPTENVTEGMGMFAAFISRD